MVNSSQFVKRLHKIRAEYELSAASFADKIQVGRATISHILSGRNKPSLDFVMKVIHTFPQVDLYWLLEGKGSFPKIEQQSPPLLPTQHQKPIIENQTILNTDQKETIPKTVSEITKQSFGKTKIKRIILFMEDGTFESYEA